MFRLMWHVLPEDKSIWIALTNIYGIGRSRSKKILDALKVPFMKKVKDISEDEQKKISDELQKYVLENDLKREVASAIKRLKCTRKNARTAKKLLGRSKVRPVLKK